jgi:hypothetical protein
MDLTCYSAKRQSSAYVDGTLRGRERSHVTAHVLRCGSCASYFEEIAALRSALRTIPAAAPPANLKTALRVIASRERQELMRTGGSHWLALWEQWKFRMDMLMRPFTIPATGGLLSSVLLFGTLAFTIGTTTRSVSYEVPVLYESRGDANLVPMELRSKVILTISLDGNGRIRDYAVGDGSSSVAGNISRLQYNNIVMPEFPSVLALAHPVSSDISISFTPLALRP